MSGDNNTVFGVARFSWDEFDRLPAPLKEALNYGFFDMGTTYVTGRLDEGENPLAVAEELDQIDSAKAAQMAREAYGWSHPQARVAGGPLPAAGQKPAPTPPDAGERFSLRGLIAKQDMRASKRG